MRVDAPGVEVGVGGISLGIGRAKPMSPGGRAEAQWAVVCGEPRERPERDVGR
jgi:hypothetical protein